jgi:NAD(P)-dependent dehydrogenase (short-subunit alcohol dehydrogenase family)
MTAKSSFTVKDIPSQAGKLAVITGATGGLGYETALALAGAKGRVVLAARNPQKGADALARIRATHPAADIRFELLDLASLASVAAFAERLNGEGAAIDVLVNNAGIMALPTRQTTVDKFEAQLGVNYLSHFALTARLLPLLRAAPAPRVVNLSSLAHRSGKIDFSDLQEERGYKPWKAYTQSKLAMLMFALELQRRSDAGGWGLMSNAAHPGFATTDLIANGPGGGGIMGLATALMAPMVSHSPAAGALPTLLAATSSLARPAAYYGPDGVYEMKGAPALARIMPQAQDRTAAARLWSVSEALTGVRYPT